jgi:acyl carrier protein
MEMKSEIEKHLGQFWDKRALDIVEDPLSVDQLGAPLESVMAVEALVDVGKMLKIKIPVEVVIRNGGYENKEQFVNLVTSGILKYVKEQGHE